MNTYLIFGDEGVPAPNNQNIQKDSRSSNARIPFQMRSCNLFFIAVLEYLIVFSLFPYGSSSVLYKKMGFKFVLEIVDERCIVVAFSSIMK